MTTNVQRILIAIPLLLAGAPLRGSDRCTLQEPARPQYEIEAGYCTVETVRKVTNEHFDDGAALRPAGPRREIVLTKNSWNVAVILYEFPDCSHDAKNTREVFQQQYFSHDHEYQRDPAGGQTYGSVYDLYREMSCGQFEVKGRAFDWICLETTREQALTMRVGGRPLHTEAVRLLLAREGNEALDPFDGIVFIWAGGPGGRATALWPIAGKVMVNGNEKPCNQFAEYFGGEFNSIGIPSHEFGHNFGFKDKYKLRNSRAGIGPWCLIGLGTHGWKPSGKKRPFHFCAWCKELIGWLQPVAIDPRVEQRIALRPVQHGPRECIRVLLRPDGSEYFLLENRARVGFFADNPSPGLLVLHVGENSRLRENYFPEYDVVPEHASGRSIEDVNLRFAPFTTLPVPGKTSLTPNSVPSSRSAAEGAWPVWITDIHVDGQGVAYFTIGRERDEPATETVFQGQRYRNATWYAGGPQPESIALSMGALVLDGSDATYAPLQQARTFERALRLQLFSEGRNRVRRPDGGKDFYGSLYDYIDEQSSGTVKVSGRCLVEKGASATMKLDLSMADIDGEHLTVARCGKLGEAFLSGYPNAAALTEFGSLLVLLPGTHSPDDGFLRADLEVGDEKIPCLWAAGFDAFRDTGGLARAWLREIGMVEHLGSETPWCLLSSGYRGGRKLGSKRPFHLCPACKSKAGYSVPSTIEAGNHVLRPVEVFGDVFRFDVGPDEYLLLETRVRLGADEYVAEEGLLIWHVTGETVALAAGPLRSGQAEIDTRGGKVRVTGTATDVRGDVYFCLQNN